MKKLTSLQNLVQAELDKMNTEAHADWASKQPYGNVGAYRVASHEGAGYLYFSDWYGIAMYSVPVEKLTQEECKFLLGKCGTGFKESSDCR